ncbi:MAG: hypothetical protein MGU50_04940 [Trichodesmium sp. MAG_R02]|nr:hypothetical protein [Trichodesmium sp. MAG_R02]
MNLSKTAKRFLSSTMAIALAGGSVLAFGSLSFAGTGNVSTSGDDTADAAVGFTGTVNAECSLETDLTSPTDTPYVPDATTYDVTDYDDGTGTTTNRTKILSADTTVNFDCNTKSVSITFPTATNTPPSGTGSGAGSLTSIHTFKYDVNASGTDTTFTSATAAITPDTKANGDVSVKITSTFAAEGDELLAGTYRADATVQVVAR